MSEFVEGVIDGRKIRVLKETTILEAAQSLGLSIPTLCHHPGLPAEGGCRLCLAEAGGKLVASCVYPLRNNGFTVLTDTPEVRAARGYVLELLINRCPRSPRLSRLAREYGVEPDPRFAGDDDLCIRCGRCVRACAANGVSAVSLVGRGHGRRVAGPFFQPPEDCVGCLACAQVCPTGRIVFEEKNGFRSIWGRKFELVKCAACGKAYATAGQLERSAPAGGPGQADLCETCRQRATADSLRKAQWEDADHV